ncbi:pyruvate dehydrogenase E1 component subunit alpha [Thermogemmatispora aurantia]|uniref:Pyruvate dehydrogenase E1 component subunit alpha n=1 Tax=Thermogemmatispora aurantia TaxID=2045279 RepID=A0A5J4KA97_9CHLR|nr:thiamine pyrophosphate-dependent dehydrogenase E1 component subunit alpha [Thermogemmatispora aurantia]GER83627.1 pyruvate dehydrogenase E1 component subunit alpha [Thermogemmatispora aurantia]
MPAEEIDRALARRLLATMQLIRAFEEAVRDHFAARHIPGFIHLSIGQEAVAAGLASALEREDYLYVTHRGHGHVIAKGADLKRVAAEIFGKASGYCRGRGGSMHIAAFEVGVLGANGVVGAGLPHAAGAAWALQLQGRQQVAVAVFGDGAVNTGLFHETANIASLWRLPLLLLCENNGYAEFTPLSVHAAVESVAERAAAYRLPAWRVDGQDPLAVRAAVREALGRVRAGEGPALVECLTWRVRGHYEGDPQRYRSSTELEEAVAHDPLRLFAERLRREGLLNEAEEAEVAAQARQAVAEAIAYAQEAAFPDPASALEDVLYQPSGAG